MQNSVFLTLLINSNITLWKAFMQLNWNLFSTKVLIQYSRTKYFHNYLASSPLKLEEICIQLNLLLDSKPKPCRKMAELSICCHQHEKILQHHLSTCKYKMCWDIKKGKPTS